LECDAIADQCERPPPHSLPTYSMYTFVVMTHGIIATGYGLDGPRIESRWGARFSAPLQTGPEAHPASCTMGTRSFPGVKSSRGVTLTPHPLLVPWSRKGRAIPLLPLWPVRPVQSLSACTVELYLYSSYGPYGLYRASVPVQGCTTHGINFWTQSVF
jgi:hypothetical protein